MDTNRKATALVITDPQNDFLNPAGLTWGLDGKSVQESYRDLYEEAPAAYFSTGTDGCFWVYRAS